LEAISEKLVAVDRSIEVLVVAVPSTVSVMVPAGMAFSVARDTPFRLAESR
jgi:hypothetical protein